MIVPIKRLTLIGRKADENALLGALQAIAAVQIIPAEEGRESALLPQWESRVQRLQSAQHTLKKYAEKQGLGPKPEMSATALAEALPASLELCARVEELERSIAGLRTEADKRRALIAPYGRYGTDPPYAQRTIHHGLFAGRAGGPAGRFGGRG
mgnify:CR=1 FL=1